MIRLPSCLIMAAALACAQSAAPFEVEEATIAQVHEAMKAGRLTCRALVGQYLKRIEAYDKNGPAINAIVVLNPEAEKQADGTGPPLRRGSGLTGPLHCVPMIVKDNFETMGLQSTDGSLALAGYLPDKDAFQVKRIKEAGAIVLAKSNMAEWAFSPYETVNSILPGYTKNPYALDRVTAGSSGGTAAAVAASFGLVGLGQRHRQLDSRPLVAPGAGRHPFDDGAHQPRRRDAAEPAGRHRRADGAHGGRRGAGVPGDRGRRSGRPGDGGGERASAAGLPGRARSRRLARRAIGVLRQAYERRPPTRRSCGIFKAAVEDLRRAGATIVDPATVEGLDGIRRARGAGPCMGFKYDLNRYLAAQGDRVPVKSLAEIIRRGGIHPPNAGAAGKGREGAGERSRVGGLQGGHARIASRCARRC